MNDFKNMEFGLHQGISNQDYHDDRSFISSSGIKLFAKDPRTFYRTYVTNELSGPSGDALDFGTYLHALVLEPHLIESEFALFTGARRAGPAWKEFQEANQDKIIISAPQAALADKLMKNYRETSLIIGKHGYEKEVPLSSFYEDGIAEESCFTELEGVKVKVRFDYRKEFEDFGSINDVKTCQIQGDMMTKKGKREVEATCEHWGYHLSAALYVDAIEKVTGKPHDFYFTFFSKKTGNIGHFRASQNMLDRGRQDYKNALHSLKEARKSGIYFENIIEELD